MYDGQPGHLWYSGAGGRRPRNNGKNLSSERAETRGQHCEKHLPSHHLGGMRVGGQKPRPIVAIFHNFKQKELVKSWGTELERTYFSVNK